MRSRWLPSLLTLLLIACKQPYPKQSHPTAVADRTPDTELRISVTIAQHQHSPKLNVALTNIGGRTLAIVTGANVGGTIYPAADLQYALLQPDGTRPQVNCRGCQAASIFGSVGPYSIFLNPTEQKTFTLNLSDLYLLQKGSEHTLDIGSDPGAVLLVRLRGTYTEAASWLGVAEGGVKLP